MYEDIISQIEELYSYCNVYGSQYTTYNQCNNVGCISSSHCASGCCSGNICRADCYYDYTWVWWFLGWFFFCCILSMMMGAARRRRMAAMRQQAAVQRNH